jgi:hypothetical protein
VCPYGSKVCHSPDEELGRGADSLLRVHKVQTRVVDQLMKGASFLLNGSSSEHAGVQRGYFGSQLFIVYITRSSTCKICFSRLPNHNAQTTLKDGWGGA